MEIALAITSGALYKLYDDITDNNTPISSLTLEIIKVLLVTTTTIIMVKNPDLTFFFAVMSVMCYFVNQFDTDFWKGWALTPFLLVLLHASYFFELSKWEIGIRIAQSIIAVLIIYLEAKLIPEEMSPRKYVSRLSFLVFEAAGAYVSTVYGFDYLVPIFLFFVGYFIANLVFHFPTVYRQLLGDEEIRMKNPEPIKAEKSDASDVLPT
jgi:hypothetical protein